jgi:hypothetical protein
VECGTPGQAMEAGSAPAGSGGLRSEAASAGDVARGEEWVGRRWRVRAGMDALDLFGRGPSGGWTNGPFRRQENARIKKCRIEIDYEL